MKKEYLKPEVAVISLVSKEEIANEDQFNSEDGMTAIDGTLNLESSIW